MEDLAKKCENLKLSKQEGDEMDLDNQEVAEGFILAAKFLTKRHKIGRAHV